MFTSIFANIINILEEPIGFEPTIKVLQTYALNHLATAPNIIKKFKDFSILSRLVTICNLFYNIIHKIFKYFFIIYFTN